MPGLSAQRSKSGGTVAALPPMSRYSLDSGGPMNQNMTSIVIEFIGGDSCNVVGDGAVIA